MHRGQRKDASGANSAFLEERKHPWEAGLALDAAHDERLLMLIHPPENRFFLGYILAAAILHLLAFFSQMPGDLVSLFVVLNYAQGIESDHLAELVGKNVKELRGIAVSTYGLRDADQGFIA